MRHTRTQAIAASTAITLLCLHSSVNAQQTTAPTPEPAERQPDERAVSPNVAGDDAGADSTKIILLSEWQLDLSPETTLSLDRILDMDVYGPDGDEIGEVENVLVSRDGRVLSLIAEVGGFWDIGDTHVNIPWDQIDIDRAAERITIPVREDTVANFPLFRNGLEETTGQVTSGEASSGITEVGGDGWGTVETGPRTWRATELLDDYVRLLGPNDTLRNYGLVDDVVIRGDEVSGVIVRPTATYGTPGRYGYLFYGYDDRWDPGRPYYDLPYSSEDITGLEPIDEDL